MKKINFFSRVLLLVSALVMASGLFAQTSFHAWEFKSGSNGIAAGKLEFVSNSITVEFWINMDESDLVENINIMESWHDPNGINVNIRKNSSNENALELRLFAKDKNSNTAYFFIPSSDFVGKWAHIAFVISDTESKALAYVNGELFEEKTGINGYYGNYRTDNSSRALNIGGKFWSSPSLTATKLADIRVWSVARTAEEIKDNYNKNLTGTHEDNSGLYLNYRFSSYERGLVNDANPEVGTNKGWCNPEAGWNTYYSRETLSTVPQNLAILDETLSWTTSEGEWEVSVFKSEDNNQAAIETVTTNSILLNSISVLEENTNYYAKVRTLNNGVWSGQVTSENFTITKGATGLNEIEKESTIYVRDGSLIVNAEKPQTLNIYTASGQLVRSVNLAAGQNIISGLAKGFYLANNHKIVIR